jgi:hypothetical protein
LLASGLFLLTVFFTRDTSVRRRGVISAFALVVQTTALFDDFYKGTWPQGLEFVYVAVDGWQWGENAVRMVVESWAGDGCKGGKMSAKNDCPKMTAKK